MENDATPKMVRTAGDSIVLESAGVMHRKVYTTTEVCNICNISLQTLKKSMKRGEISFYRIPDSLDRLIPEESMRSYMINNKMQGSDFAPFQYKVLIITGEISDQTFEKVTAVLDQTLEDTRIHITTEPSYQEAIDIQEGVPTILEDSNSDGWTIYRLQQRMKKDLASHNNVREVKQGKVPKALSEVYRNKILTSGDLFKDAENWKELILPEYLRSED